jgi:predicted acyl esterase
MIPIIKVRSKRAISRFSLLLLLTIVVLAIFDESALGQQPVPSSSPTPEQKIQIDFNRRVRMRDGVELSADIYRPQALAFS